MTYSISDIDRAYSTLELGICESTFKCTLMYHLLLCAAIHSYSQSTTPDWKRTVVNFCRLALLKTMPTVDVPSTFWAPICATSLFVSMQITSIYNTSILMRPYENARTIRYAPVISIMHHASWALIFALFFRLRPLVLVWWVSFNSMTFLLVFSFAPTRKSKLCKDD